MIAASPVQAIAASIFSVSMPRSVRAFAAFFGVELAVARQSRKRRARNRSGIHFEMRAQMIPVIAASEAIRAQRQKTSRQPGSDLILHRSSYNRMPR